MVGGQSVAGRTEETDETPATARLDAETGEVTTELHVLHANGNVLSYPQPQPHAAVR
jgi:hypothetical protein